MSDLGHIVWAVALVVVVLVAARVAFARFELYRRQIDLSEERRKQVEQLTKRFEAIEQLSNGLKAEWLNLKLRK